MTLSTTDSLAVYLASLSAPDLARIVTTTPTVPDDPRPTTLRHVAVCLADPETALLGCSFLSRGELQLLEALWAIAEERPPGGAARLGRDAAPRLDDDPVVVVDPQALLGLLGGPPEVGAMLDALSGRVLAWPEDGRIRLHPGAASVFPLPLGLAAPAYGLLLVQEPAELQVIVRELGGLPVGGKDANAMLAARLLAEPEVVRRVVSRLDASARAVLDDLAEVGVRRDPAAAWGHFGARGTTGPETDVFVRLRRRGLLLPAGDGWEMMPREVALALRGDDYRVPFEARPPHVATVRVDRAAAAHESAASAARALDLVARLLRACAVRPPRLRPSGGVGGCELRRLAAELGCDDDAVRLWLHVAEAAGLLLADTGRGRVLPTHGYDAWLDDEPAARLLALVQGWITMPEVPTLDAADPVAPGTRPPAALAGTSPHGGLALVARGALLRTLRTLGAEEAEGAGGADEDDAADDHAVADAASLARRVAWVCPTPFRQSLAELVEEVEADAPGPPSRDTWPEHAPAFVWDAATTTRFGAGPDGLDHPDHSDRPDHPDHVPEPVLVSLPARNRGLVPAPVPADNARHLCGAAPATGRHRLLPGTDPAGHTPPAGPADRTRRTPHPDDADPLPAGPTGPTGPAGPTGPGSPCACAECAETADEIAHAYRGRFDAPAFTATALHEAAALGLVAAGALTPLGHGIAAQHGAHALLAAAEELLPPAADRARLHPDLTAVVTGTPTAGLARLLGGCAEAQGTDQVWRFTEDSVRRHLDAGGTAAGLLADLAAHAVNELPTPLDALIRGVGRRHGQVRAASAASVVYAEDAALITELLHQPRLFGLRWRRVAPTVLLSAEPLDRVVDRLRRAGYAPAAETETGSAVVARPAEFRAETPEPAGSSPGAPPPPQGLPPDWRTWAGGLLARATRPPPPLPAKAARLREAAPLLGPEDCLVLADALDRGSAVRVAATAYNGEPLTSTVAHLARAGDGLYMRPPNGRPALLPFRLETLWLVLPEPE
ncbi:helicase-associated domain-containing protein [Yinghuangia sp. ASG 101]|uniref:helicase-associated domain-containing protein n=1 Tax=Yinghuangia sp. ASG 101 TaxID=2896848 RepID=UPI001E33607E|nr:helicase-associated domain-containing protein [Yinghuangia sp. ASG 101]UGQ10263.1 helicase-associated domain-containing protein [Yinghuangia sp. ASG 101]